MPHPRICERAFVLYPLRDLLSVTTTGQATEDQIDLKINDKSTLYDCIAKLSKKDKSEIKEYSPHG